MQNPSMKSTSLTIVIDDKPCLENFSRLSCREQWWFESKYVLIDRSRVDKEWTRVGVIVCCKHTTEQGQ